MKGLKAFAFFCMLVFVLVVSGCSDSSDTASTDESSSDSEKTITFMHLWPEGSSKEHYQIVEEIISDFEKEHEGVKVKVEVLSNEQYKDKIKVLASSDKLPDVGMTWAAGYLTPYVDANKFAELDDILADGLKDTFVPGTTEAYAIDDKTYGLPLELNIAPIFYNKAIFDQYGLEKPETYDDFKHIIEVLNENNVAPIALGNKDRWTGSLWYMYMADRMAGPDVVNGAVTGNGNGTFEDPQMIAAAQEIQSLVDMNAFVKGFNGLADEEAKSMFMNGQAAMYLIGSWDLPNYTTNEDVPQEFRDSIDYFNFPTVNGSGDVNSFVGGPGVGLFVSEQSEVKDEAKEFVKYFVDAWGSKAVTGAGVIPATKLDTNSLDLPEMYIDVLDDLNNASNITMFADVLMSTDAAQVHLDMIQALFGEEVTPEEFAKNQAEAVEASK